jgi:phosphoribosyl-AMP cyclohydrolase
MDLLDLPIDEALARIDFDSAGLVPVITQEAGTGRVLMLAWMDEAAFRSTVATKRGTYFSRSRGRQWVKGETSGHEQKVVAVQLDCDGDAVLMLVEQIGPACHTGAHSCFDTGGIR